jgi:hypothetical protein
MKTSKYKYGSLTKELFLSAFSLVVLYMFMGFTATVEGLNNQGEKILTSNNETLQNEYNYDYFISNNVNLPAHSLKTENHYSHKFTLDNIDEISSSNRELTCTESDYYSVRFNLENSTRNIFNKQLIIDTKYPTDKALRSDILII